MWHISASGFWDISFHFLQRNFTHFSPLLEQAIPVQVKEHTGAVVSLLFWVIMTKDLVMQFLKQKAKKLDLQIDLKKCQYEKKNRHQRMKERCRTELGAGHQSREGTSWESVICLAIGPLFCFCFLFFSLFLMFNVSWFSWKRSLIKAPQSPPPFTRSALSSGRWQLFCLGVSRVQTGLSVMRSESVVSSSVGPVALPAVR